jgi:hypothetical protein
MIFTPPMNIAERDKSLPSIFLAGSIEMGSAEDWQTTLGKFFVDKGYNVFNPRRIDWDSSWVQTYTNPQFYQQVHWELNALDKADQIIMYLDPATKSPISLMELGLHANSKKLVVICPEGFYRKGNVEAVCAIYDIRLYNSIDQFKKDYELSRLS